MALTIVETRAITGGVDTHADVHVAAALDPIGGLLGVRSSRSPRLGMPGLLGWLGGFGTVVPGRDRGHRQHGAGRARHVTAAGVRVVEVDRSDRQDRRRQGKSDPHPWFNHALFFLGREERPDNQGEYDQPQRFPAPGSHAQSWVVAPARATVHRITRATTVITRMQSSVARALSTSNTTRIVSRFAFSGECAHALCSRMFLRNWSRAAASQHAWACPAASSPRVPRLRGVSGNGGRTRRKLHNGLLGFRENVGSGTWRVAWIRGR